MNLFLELDPTAVLAWIRSIDTINTHAVRSSTENHDLTDFTHI